MGHCYIITLPKLKILKWSHFELHEEIHCNMTTVLKGFFKNSSNNIYRHGRNIVTHVSVKGLFWSKLHERTVSYRTSPVIWLPDCT